MKKTLAKILAIALCAVLLVSGSVFVTLAYLQRQTQTVRNTFCTADIMITLDEAKVNVYGQLVDTAGNVFTDAEGQTLAARIPNDASGAIGNEYKLVPGSTYVKDPTVHIEIGSEPCYVYIAIKDTLTKNNANWEAATVENGYQNIATQLSANGWVKLEATLNAEALNKINDGRDGADKWAEGQYTIYYYEDEVKVAEGEGAKNEDLPIFTEFKVASGSETEIKADGCVIEVVAFATQSAGWSGETAIADAFDATFGS